MGGGGGEEGGGKSHHRLFPLPRLNFHNSISGRRKRRGGRTEGEGGKVKFYFRVLGLKISPPPSPFYPIILLLWKRIRPLWCRSLSGIHKKQPYVYSKKHCFKFCRSTYYSAHLSHLLLPSALVLPTRQCVQNLFLLLHRPFRS